MELVKGNQTGTHLKVRSKTASENPSNRNLGILHLCHQNDKAVAKCVFLFS